jgi:Ca-activated chloride channel family protein
MKEDNIKLKIKTDLNLICKEVPTKRVLELVVQAPEAMVSKERPGLNLALVIDRSGSMRGGKLANAKKAALHVLDMLQKQDHVTIVAYDDQVITLTESVPVTSETRMGLKAAVHDLAPGGMTNLSGGWLTGCQNVALVQQDDLVNRALLLTDGLANEGITDMEELGRHARELHMRGIATSTFGVGQGFNEHLLEQMANQGGGNFYLIDHPQAIPTIFMRELEELTAITAKDVEINIELPAQVDVQVLGGWKHEKVDGKLRISLGDMASKQKREIYARLLTPPSNSKEHLVVEVEVLGKNDTGEFLHLRKKAIFNYSTQDIVLKSPLDEALMARARRCLETALQINAAYMPSPIASEYRNLSERMKRGLTELDRKVSHYQSYRHKKRRDS